MAIKHKGVKIVPVKVTRYEVRTVDGRKLRSFSSTGSARAWIDGYVSAVQQLAPRSVEPKPEPVTEAKANGVRRPRRKAEPAEASA